MVVLICSFIALDQPLEAAQALARRVDLPALKAATHVTLVANEIAACMTYAVRYVQECQLVGDWLAAQQLLQCNSCFQVWYSKLINITI